VLVQDLIQSQPIAIGESVVRGIDRVDR
jgi:hypothetical protein